MGAVGTERDLDYIKEIPEEISSKLHLESPWFTGKIISTIYAADELMYLSGQAHIGAELAIRFGVSDINGTQPPSCRDTT